MQTPLIASIAAVLCLVPAAATADESKCVDRDSMSVHVEPTAFDPALAKLVTAQLARELDDTASNAQCPQNAAPVSLVRIAVRWPDDAHAEVHVEARWGNVGRTAVRVVELTHVPPDGRALAVAIASTELLDELLAEHATAPPPIAAAPKRSVTPTPPSREPFGAFGIASSFLTFSHGPAFVGPDARLGFVITPRIDASVRFGVRASIGGSPPGTTYVFGAALGLSPRPMSERLGVAARLTIDTVSMPLGGIAAQETVIVPAIGIGAWTALSRRSKLSADVTIGAPVRSESARTRGLVASVTIAALVLF